MIKKIAALMSALALAMIGLSVAPVSATTTSATAPCTIRMIEWGVNAPGTDKPSNANYEFKRLYNPGPSPVTVEGWYVQDSYPHVYKLEASKLPAGSPFRVGTEFVMPVGSNVYVYNGTGTDANPTNLTAALYSNLGHHHNNAGDTLSVHDATATVVDWVTYTPYRTRHAC